LTRPQRYIINKPNHIQEKSLSLQLFISFSSLCHIHMI